MIGCLALLTLKEPKEAKQPPRKPWLRLPFMSGGPPVLDQGKLTEKKNKIIEKISCPSCLGDPLPSTKVSSQWRVGR